MEDPKNVYEIKNFTNKSGRTVVELRPVGGGNSEFHGSTMVEFRDGNAPINFPFDSSITSIEQCFNDFDTAANNYIEKIVEQKSKEGESPLIETPPST